jgi:hypothetical protein
MIEYVVQARLKLRAAREPTAEEVDEMLRSVEEAIEDSSFMVRMSGSPFVDEYATSIGAEVIYPRTSRLHETGGEG